MRHPDDFTFFVEDDELEVRFVSAKKLGRLGDEDGHARAGDYSDNVIRLARYEYRTTNRASLLHELGHYLVDRQELKIKRATEEDICDLLTWLPKVLNDPRNDVLRSFLLEQM